LCPASSDVVVITFNDFVVPQGFSPNGDNKNDKFEIMGLENYSGVSLKVVNRWGQEVYSSSDYKNDWDGSGLEEDTYFYVLNIPGTSVKNGFVVLKRK
jgi:gliding motility-associated-like protein